MMLFKEFPAFFRTLSYGTLNSCLIKYAKCLAHLPLIFKRKEKKLQNLLHNSPIFFLVLAEMSLIYGNL